MKLQVKVCGMRESDNIKEIEKLPISFMGFIFHEPSPRYVSRIPSYLPQTMKRVGVFVNSTATSIKEIAEQYKLDYIQLHGDESPDFCTQLYSEGFQLIKAFRIKSENDLELISAYEKSCDFFLFDAPTDKYGGSGQTFDWKLLSSYSGSKPFLLSGGIGIDTIESLLLFKHPQLMGYDLNSKFETYPGHKEYNLLQTFINRMK